MLALLAGCAGAPTPRAVTTGDESVTYEFPTARKAEAERLATLYCANLGRVARLGEERGLGDGLSRARFVCR